MYKTKLNQPLNHLFTNLYHPPNVNMPYKNLHNPSPIAIN